jgi:hypothetical protein
MKELKIHYIEKQESLYTLCNLGRDSCVCTGFIHLVTCKNCIRELDKRSKGNKL